MGEEDRSSYYRVNMTAEVSRTVQANSEREALWLVDRDDMMFELKRTKVDTEFTAEKIDLNSELPAKIEEFINQRRKAANEEMDSAWHETLCQEIREQYNTPCMHAELCAGETISYDSVGFHVISYIENGKIHIDTFEYTH